MIAFASTDRSWNLPSRTHIATFYIVTLLTAVLCRRYIFDSNDPYKCRALLEGGKWYHNDLWLPTGCSTESYDLRAIQDCARDRKIVLAGDSTLQGTFWAVAAKLNGDVVRQPPVEADLHFANERVELEYIYDPYLNSSQVFRYAQAYREHWDEAPLVLVVGSGLAYARADETNGFVDAIRRVAEAAPSANRRIAAASKAFSYEDGPGDLLLFAPAQGYASGDLSGAVLNDEMNRELSKLSEASDIDVLWSFADMMMGRTEDRLVSNEPMYASPEIESAKADVLLGLRCNAKAASRTNFPNTRTCCANWRPRNRVQNAFLLLGLLLLPSLVLLDLLRPLFSNDGRTLLRALASFSAVICLQYIADRTHIFEQVHRIPYQLSNLLGMIFLTALIGIITLRRSKPPPPKAAVAAASLNPPATASSPRQPDQPFLSRDQTDEWKGSMQVLILIYHWNGAWYVDWYWKIIRTCVASYLFLTGFGHTLYFLQKKDLSLRRVVAVLIRTNMLPVTLAYVMRTRWLLYYYMPLSTFWFLVVWATLSLKPEWNEKTTLLLFKIATSAALVQAFIRTQGLPEATTHLFEIIFKLSFDANAFFGDRVRMDAYIVYIGMLAAMLYLHITEALKSNTRTWLKRTWPLLIKPLTLLLSLVLFPLFWAHAYKSMPHWSDFQPYITCLPILTFTVLRNAHPTLQNYHSAAFAWLGRYSGEMYVMQDHLWLVGDQDAHFRTGWFNGNETLARDRWRDLVLLTPLYLIGCQVVGDATGMVARWFVEEGERGGGRGEKVERREVEMGLLGDGDGDGDGGDGGGENQLRRRTWLSWRRVRLWPATVRDRSLLVLGILWFLNLTYE